MSYSEQPASRRPPTTTGRLQKFTYESQKERMRDRETETDRDRQRESETETEK